MDIEHIHISLQIIFVALRWARRKQLVNIMKKWFDYYSEVNA